MCFVFISVAIYSLDSFLMFFQVQLKIFLLELNNKKIPTKILVNIKSIHHHVKIFRFFNNYKIQFVNGQKK